MMTTVMENGTTRHATGMEEVLLAKVKTLEAELANAMAWQDQFAERLNAANEELAALRQQQGEPVGWLTSNGEHFWPASKIKNTENPLIAGMIPLYREAAPRVPEEALRLVLWWARSRQGECDPEKLIAAADAVERAMLAAAPEPNAPPPTTDTMPR